MKAWLIRGYGGPERLEQGTVPDPEVGPRDVLVDIRAASVNPIDWKIRRGMTKLVLRYAMPLVLGNDCAGEVLAVGSEVRDFQPGDAVMTRVPKDRIGTFAERIAVREDAVARTPESVDFAQAAALPLAGLTAWQALVDLGGVGPGHKVLVQAGAGGVGTLAIQLAKHLGAHVATTASAPKHALLRELGADECIDYRSQDFAAVLRDCDFVLDSLGGEALSRSFAILRPGGMVVSIAGVPDPAFARNMGLGPALRLAVRLMSWPTRRRAARHGAAYHYLFMHASGEQLATLAGLVDQGALRPIVDRVFPFDAVDQAIAYAEQGHATGKVIVTR